MSTKKEKGRNIEKLIEEINEYSKRMKQNRFHKRDNPVLTLTKEPKKEQKVDKQNKTPRAKNE